MEVDESMDDFLQELLDNPSEELDVVDDSQIEDTIPLEESVPLEETTPDETSSAKVPKKIVKPKYAPALPLSKIKSIMKMDPDVVSIGAEAAYTLAKATEFFIQAFAKQTYESAAAQKKKTIRAAHIETAIKKSEALFFLEDALE